MIVWVTMRKLKCVSRRKNVIYFFLMGLIKSSSKKEQCHLIQIVSRPNIAARPSIRCTPNSKVAYVATG